MTGPEADDAQRTGRDLAISGLLHAAGRSDGEGFVARVMQACASDGGSTAETSPRSERERPTFAANRQRVSRSSRRSRIQNHRGPRSHRWGWVALGSCLTIALVAVVALATGDRGGLGSQPAGPASAVGSQLQIVAHLVDPDGTVAVRRGGRNLHPGDGFGVAIGDRLSIANAGSAALAYPDGTRIDAVAGTIFDIARGSDGGKVLSLDSGRLDAAVAPQRHDLRIVSRQVTLQVVGTRFSFAAAPSVSTIAVDEGRVHLSNDIGNLMLDAGQRAVVADGAAPELVGDDPAHGERPVVRDDFTLDTGRWQRSEHGFPVRFQDGAVVVDCRTSAAAGYAKAGWASGASGVGSKAPRELPLRVSARVGAQSDGDYTGVLAAIVLEPDRPDPGWILYLVRTRERVELRRQDLRQGGREPVLVESVRKPSPWPEWETIAFEVDDGRCRVQIDDVVVIDRPTPEEFDPSFRHHIHLLGNASRQTGGGIVRFDWVTVE